MLTLKNSAATRTPPVAQRLCDAIAVNREMPNATARIAAWMIGAAERTGGFPLEISLRHFTEGFNHRGVPVQGTGSHTATVKAALRWLAEQGWLHTSPGRLTPGKGPGMRKYTLDIPCQK